MHYRSTHSNSSSTFSENGNLIRVSTKWCNIISNPTKSFNDVFHAVISLSSSVARSQETQDSKSIIESDDNNAIVNEKIWAINPAVAATAGEWTSVNPDHHSAVASQAWSVNIQEQTIFGTADF